MILEKRLGVSLFLICQIQAKSDIAKYKNCDMIKHTGKTSYNFVIQKTQWWYFSATIFHAGLQDWIGVESKEL